MGQTRWRCVSLKAVGYFRPYPSIRSIPMWAAQTSASCVASIGGMRPPCLAEAILEHVVGRFKKEDRYSQS